MPPQQQAFHVPCNKKIHVSKTKATFPGTAMSIQKLEFMRKRALNRRLRMLMILLALTRISYGQNVETSLNAYAGLFSFRGEGATLNSSIISYPFINPPMSFTVNPYGKKNGFSYALEFQGQRLSKRKNIYGLGLSFEVLKSNVNIYKIGVSGDPAYLEYPATGNTRLQNAFITLNPFIGHRFSASNITFDLLTGLDLAFFLKTKEVENARINNKSYSIKSENSKANPSMDFRPRIQLKAHIRKVGFLAGYSLGLTNYQTSGNSKTYSCLLRLGLSYLVK